MKPLCPQPARVPVHTSKAPQWLLALALAAGWPLAGAQVPAGAPDTPEAVNNSPLDARLFYQLLLGEIQLSEGNPGAAFSLVLDAARRQRDGALFQRAIQIALQARSGDSALTAARAWQEALPKATDARRFELQILLALNKAAETPPVLEALLQDLPAGERNDALHAIPQTYSRLPDKVQVLSLLKPLLERHAKTPEHTAAALSALGRLQLAANQPEAALASAQRAVAARPTDPLAALLALELMERGQAQAEPLVQRHVQSAEGRASTAVWTAYARLLMDLQRLPDARRELQAITRAHPDAAEPWLLKGGLDLQERKADEAAASVQRYMALARDSGDERLVRGLNQAYLLMAQIAEVRADYPAANAWLDRIENNEGLLSAQVRRASLLAKQGKLQQARELLRKLPERRPEDARLKLMAEAQLLKDLKQFDQAYAVYQQALRQNTDDTDLIYEAAMTAERAGRLEDMERLLRQIIQLKPDLHHAYNALGYSLADRNVRLNEARVLIEKAVALAPQDAYIRDSLAWVEFRQGNLAKAQELLESAYRQQPDAEIAAHLGEVLWSRGNKDQALKVWHEGLLLAPDNETLQSTLRRLNVKP